MQKSILLSNIVVGMQERLTLMQKMELDLDGDNLKHKRSLQECNAWDAVWTDKFAAAVASLWADPTFQKVHELGAEHQMQISHLKFLIDRMNDYLNPDYVLTNDDFLRARQRTAGCNEVTFVREKMEWSLVDMGGQLNEREKWIKYLRDFQNVEEGNGKPPISFLAFLALDEYDVRSNEEPDKTKFLLSLDVITKFAQLKEASEMLPIVLLNKLDLFKAKIESTNGFASFKKHFPDYTGEQNADAAAEFVQNMVEKTLRTALQGRDLEEIPVNLSCALDAQLMGTVFENIQFHCFALSLNRAGM